MVSSFPAATPPPPRASMRRGGPLLFRTLWPEVRDQLAEAAGLELSRRFPSAANDEGEPPPPPWSRAA